MRPDTIGASVFLIACQDGSFEWLAAYWAFVFKRLVACSRWGDMAWWDHLILVRRLFWGGGVEQRHSFRGASGGALIATHSRAL